MEILKKKFTLPIIITALGLISYFPVLISSKTMNPDIEFIWNAFPHWNNLLSYFHDLFAFKVIDFQPIRDLTIYIDWFFFTRFSINTAIWQNLIYWWISLLFIFRILVIENIKISRFQILIGLLLFSIYPLFSVSIAWGMARKHILALMFITLATSVYLKAKNSEWRWKNICGISLAYFLSIFSQPITILWPFWVLADSWISGSKKKISIRLAIPLMMIFLTGFVLNYNYYNQSQIFTETFTSKTSDAFDLADKVLAIGHYFFELLFPYNQGFYSSLGSTSVLLGLVILVVVVLGFLKDKKNIRENIRWIIFGILPLGIVLNTPKLLFSTYLLLPALAAFIILMKHIEQWNLAKGRLLLVLIIIAWTGLNIYESTLWTDPIRFAEEKNFARKPNCVSASRLVRQLYALGVKPEPALRQFLVENECLQVDTKYKMMDFIVLRSHMIYYDNEISLQERLSALDQLTKVAFYPNLIKAALLIEHQKPGAEELLTESIARLGSERIPPQHDLIVSRVVKPYCETNKLSECLRIANDFTVERKAPFF